MSLESRRIRVVTDDARPGVRQRTLEAIGALHLNQDPSSFPLSMSKIVKMLSTEEDDTVLLVVLRILRQVLEVSP